MFPRFFAWCIPTSIFIQLNDFCTCTNMYTCTCTMYCVYSIHNYIQHLYVQGNINSMKWTYISKAEQLKSEYNVTYNTVSTSYYNMSTHAAHLLTLSVDPYQQPAGVVSFRVYSLESELLSYQQPQLGGEPVDIKQVIHTRTHTCTHAHE